MAPGTSFHFFLFFLVLGDTQLLSAGKNHWRRSHVLCWAGGHGLAGISPLSGSDPAALFPLTLGQFANLHRGPFLIS